MSDSDRSRWPARIYVAGREPDPRFSLANERTLLAWIRTALGLVGGGVVIDAVDLDVASWAQSAIGAVLVVLGGVAAAGGWIRWASAERSLRLGKPLPGLSLAAVVVAGLVVVSMAVLAAIVAS
jgi:putative membrane protein